MKNLLRFLAPARCPLCEREIPVRGFPICTGCRPVLEAAALAAEQRCRCCFYPLAPGGQECRFCSGRAVFFDQHRALYGLTSAWRRVLHRWKFEQERELFRAFLPALATRNIAPDDASREEWGVVYIDSGREGLARRSFQPCLDPARELAALTRLRYAPHVRKTRNRQSANTRLYRFFRVQGSLRTRGRVPEKVLLLEDVFTTGATANEAARILKKNGANFVRVISLLFREDLLTGA